MAKFPARLPRSRLEKPRRSRKPSQPGSCQETLRFTMSKEEEIDQDVYQRPKRPLIRGEMTKLNNASYTQPIGKILQAIVAPFRGIWRETVLLLDDMWPWSNQHATLLQAKWLSGDMTVNLLNTCLAIFFQMWMNNKQHWLPWQGLVFV